jgi:hypothetical protein
MPIVNTYELIEARTLASATSTITLDTLPTTYENLILKLTTPVSNSNTAGRTILRFNSDTGSNYHYKYLGSSNASVSGGNETNSAYTLIGYYGGANSISIVDILGYRSSFHKTSVTRYGNNYPEAAIGVNVWRNTTAITSITVSCLGTFPVGTKVALYGLAAA